MGWITSNQRRNWPRSQRIRSPDRVVFPDGALAAGSIEPIRNLPGRYPFYKIPTLRGIEYNR